MIVYLTSSPCIDGAERAVLNPANDFLDNIREALPAFFGFGSGTAHTTLATPAAINASQQAPTRPCFEHGSRVT